MYSSSPKVVRIRIRAVLLAARMRRVASIPSSSGIRMSIRMTVGSNCDGHGDGFEPVARFADDFDVPLAGEQHPEARADHGLVVGDEDSDRHDRSEASGRRVLSVKPPPLLPTCSHLAAVELDALADADQSVAVAVARGRAGAVVVHFDPDLVGRIPDGDLRVAGVGVLERVGETLLNNPVGGDVDPGREREALAVDAQLDGQSGAADLLEQPAEAVKAGLRRQLDTITVMAHDIQQMTHVRQGSAAGLLDSQEGSAIFGHRVGELVPDGADLQDHHADGVRDGVVQLARDPRPLLAHGDTRRGIPFLLGLCRM